MREHKWEFEERVGGLIGRGHECFRCLYCDAIWCETHKEYVRGSENCARAELPAAQIPISRRRVMLDSVVTIVMVGVIDWYALETLDLFLGVQFDVRQFIIILFLSVFVYQFSIIGRYRRSRSR
jgi:hypothetical protein